MDANDGRRIEREITSFITHHFRVEGKTFFEKLQYLAVASSVKDKIKRSLLDDLHELRKLRNDIVHHKDAEVNDVYERVREGLLRLVVPELENVPFLIINKNSGRCLDVPWETLNGKIHQWEVHKGKNQHWYIRKAKDGHVVVISALNGQCLDVEGNNKDTPAWLQVWDYHGGDNQKFKFNLFEDGSYSITVKHSGFVLDIWSSGIDNGNWITQWEWHGGG